MASLKMQQIIKQTSPSRQLFEAVNFAFMKFFHFQSKQPFLGHFSFFLRDSCHPYLSGSSVRVRPYSAITLDRNLLEKRRNVLKMAVLTKKSKIFIKAKLTASKSCLLGLVYSMICCILRDAILLSLDLLKFQSLEFQIFQHF